MFANLESNKRVSRDLVVEIIDQHDALRTDLMQQYGVERALQLPSPALSRLKKAYHKITIEYRRHAQEALKGLRLSDSECHTKIGPVTDLAAGEWFPDGAVADYDAGAVEEVDFVTPDHQIDIGK